MTCELGIGNPTQYKKLDIFLMLGKWNSNLAYTYDTQCQKTLTTDQNHKREGKSEIDKSYQEKTLINMTFDHVKKWIESDITVVLGYGKAQLEIQIKLSK